MEKEETEKRKKELRNYLKDKFTGILARKKWDMDDIGDVLDLVKELLKSEREKLLEKIDEIIDDDNDLLRQQREELKEKIKKGRQN